MTEVKRKRRHRELTTVNRLLAGADRADLANRAEEIARTGKSPMLLVWYDDGDVVRSSRLRQLAHWESRDAD